MPKFGILKGFWILFFAIFLMLILPLLHKSKDGSPLPLANDISLPQFMPLEKVSDLEGVSFTLHMNIVKVDRLNAVDRFSIKFGTYFKAVEIFEADLMQRESACRYRLMRPQVLVDGGLLELESGPCAWKNDSNFLLKVRGKSVDGLAVIGYEGLSKTQANPQVLAVDAKGGTLAVAGTFEPNIRHATFYVPRISLLAYLWKWENNQVGFAFILFFSLLAIAFSLSILACLIWSRHGSGSFTFIALACLLVMSLQVSYSLLVPPFLAPDEPDHFLAFAKIGGLTRADQESLSLANHGHFDRLMCHFNEKFTWSDWNQPMEQTHWNSFHVIDVDVSVRSAYADVIWPMMGSLLFTNQSSPENVLLGVRLANGLYFTLIFSITALIFRRLEDVDVVDFLLALCVIPTVFHFSNHVSNHAYIISHYLPLVFGFRPLLKGKAMNPIMHAWLGLNIGICMIAGKLGLIFFLVALGCYFIRWFCIGSMQTRFSWRTLVEVQGQFLLLLLCCALPLILFRNTSYVSSQIPTLMRTDGFIPKAAVALAVLLGPCLGLGVGYALTLLMERPFIFRIVKALFFICSFGMICLLFFPLFKSVPPLLNIEYLSPPLPMLSYARKVLTTFFLTSGWGGQDFYLIESFWSGFSCPDPVLSNFVVQGLKGTMASLLVFGFIWSVRKNDWRTSIVYLLAGGILTANLVMMAYGTALQQSNLHGRYMLGFYFLLIQIASLVFYEVPGRFKRFRDTGFVASIALVQIASVWYLVGRYF